MTSTLSQFKQAVAMNTLRSCQLFAGMPSTDLANIAELTITKKYEKGEYVFRERDVSHGFYVVQSGSINLHRVNGTGKEQLIHVFRAGESFAEGTLANDAGYPADARALEASEVMQIQKPGFLSLLRRQPELSLRMLGAMSVHLRVLISQLEDLTSKDVETRLAKWLVRRCPNPDSVAPAKIELKMTKRVLAAELGTVSETLSRTLAKFRDQRLLYVNGKSVTVLHPAKMATMLRRNLGEECV